MSRLFQRLVFVIRIRYLRVVRSYFRKVYYSMCGLKVGRKTNLPKFTVTWPHQVIIGENCLLEDGISFKFDGVWKPGPAIILADNVFVGSGCEFNIRLRIEVGSDTLIASGCRFIDHDHGIKTGELIRKQHGPEDAIKIGGNVWLGCNVIVLKGVEIGEGAIVGAGAVVTKSIASGEIWAGVPAKKIGQRG